MKYILYVNCNDRVIEYSLPAITNRKCSVNIAEIDPDCYLEVTTTASSGGLKLAL